MNVYEGQVKKLEKSHSDRLSVIQSEGKLQELGFVDFCSMNRLIEILVRWTIHKYTFHTDLQKLYNEICLHTDHWQYQLYLWDPELRVDTRSRYKVIETLIYEAQVVFSQTVFTENSRVNAVRIS